MRRFYLFFILIGLLHVAHSQSTDQQTADITHSLLQNIQWPQEKATYKLQVISQKSSLKKAFENMAASKTIEGRALKVGFSNYINIPSDADAIFLSSVYNGGLQTVIDRIGSKPILIITEQSPDQLYVMANLLKSGQSVSFEFNKANIENQSLKLKPGFRALGGSEINVAQLYRQVRDAMRTMESRAKSAQDRMDSLNLNTALAYKIAKDNFDQLDAQKLEIERRQKELDRQNGMLDSLTLQLGDSEQQLVQLEGEIEKQEELIKDGDQTLLEQEDLIKKRNREIEKKERELRDMGAIVVTQKNTLWFLIIFSLFLVVVLFIAYRAYQARRKAAKVLNQQKEELKELLDELQSTQTQLVQSEKMASLGTLTAGIAHEINNAINYVHSGIHVLDGKFNEIQPLIADIKELEGGGDTLEQNVAAILKKKEDIGYDSAQEVIHTMIKSIKVGAERTINIVKGLRTFSRGQEENMSEMDLHEDINVSLLLLKNKIHHNVQIKKNFAPALPTMYGFPGQVGQAILNIVGNAIDAISESSDPKILIKTEAVGKKVNIHIRDNGVGIKREDIDKIFDPFYTTKKIGEGTGLGLSITYGIIEKHNGTIKVNSKVGVGTEFKIQLPLNDQTIAK